MLLIEPNKNSSVLLDGDCEKLFKQPNKNRSTTLDISKVSLPTTVSTISSCLPQARSSNSSDIHDLEPRVIEDWELSDALVLLSLFWGIQVSFLFHLP